MSLLTDSSSRRSEQDHQAALQLEQEYREHAATLDRYLNGTFGTALSQAEREEARQQAFVGLATEYANGVEIQSTEAMLIACARNAAYSVLRSADRRRRKSFDPHDSAEARLADTSAPVDLAVVDADENRRVKMLMEQLDERSRTVLQLRLECDLDGPEIAEHLGLSPSHAYRLLRHASRALADSITANDQGAHSRQQRALLAACEMGTATPDERERAKRLLEGDAHARALLAELRGLGHQAAALMPPVAVAGAAPSSSGRISHMLASVKQHVSDLVGRSGSAQEAATQVAAGGGLRGGGAVSQAVVAGVLACMGAGGYAATVCVTEGPAALVDKLPGTDGSKPEPQEQVVEAPVAPVVEPLTTVPEQAVAPAEPVPAEPAPDAQAATEPAPAPPTASDSVSGLGGNPTATPAPAPTPPPAASGGGGGGGGGSSGSTFGGL
jgi:RNA polymerase sigma factor (sigma-70 family)